MRGADRGAKFRQSFAQFSNTVEAVKYLKDLEPEGLQILGVEITKDSESIANYQYKGPTAFVFGNEGKCVLRALAIPYNFFFVIDDCNLHFARGGVVREAT